MGYTLGFDLGTTFTAAAVVRDGRAEIVALGNHTASIPSVVFLRDDGELLVGDVAERRGVQEPARLARTFKRRFGDSAPIMLDRSPFSADRLITVVLSQVVADVVRRQGGPPDRVAVTHPANWGAYKIDLMRQAVQAAGIDDAVFVTEPVAAAVRYASTERVEPGGVIAVYDLGGGTFDAAVLRTTVDGFETLGAPQGIERLGGIDFDEAVLAHVRATLGESLESLDGSDPAVRAALAKLRDECVAAKEALSSDSEATIAVLLPNLQTQVRITRAEFEDVIRPIVRETVQSLRRAIDVAGVEPHQVQAVLLAGGSSRIPLVAEMVGAALERPVVVDTHPKHAVALGAALVAARGSQAPSLAPPPPPVAPMSPAAPPPPAAVAPVQPEPLPAGPTISATAQMPAAAAVQGPATASASPPRSKRTALVAGAAVAAVVAVVVGVLAFGGGDGGDASAVTTGAPTTDVAITTATTVETSITIQPSSTAAAATTTATTLPPEATAPATAPPISIAVDCDGLDAEDGLPLIGCEEGPNVQRVQTTLDALGYPLDVDGQYGPATATAVAQFQDALGFAPTGKVDRATWDALGLDVSKVCQPTKDRWVCLSDAWIEGGWLNATYEWAGFSPAVSGGFHFHFYGDTVSADGAGVPASGSNWVVWDDDTLRVSTSAASSFTGADELCVLVGRSDHSVVPESGNCVPIRATSGSAPTVTFIPNWEVLDGLRPVISIPFPITLLTTTTTTAP